MYERILVPVDGSATATAGLEEAIRLAKLSGGAIRLLHVIDDMPYIPESAMYGVSPADQTRRTIERGRKLLDDCEARVSQAGIKVDSVLVEGLGRHLEAFVSDIVSSWAADVVVLGTHGRRGLGRVVLGSDAEQVVRKATVPVLLVRHEAKAGSRQQAETASRASA